jgi:hypothetical protein
MDHLVVKGESRENLVNGDRSNQKACKVHTDGVLTGLLSIKPISTKGDRQPLRDTPTHTIIAMAAASSALLAPLLLLLSLFSAVVHCSGTGGSPLDTLCGNLGGYYVTPELCTSALCGPDPSACRSARGAPDLAALAARLAAANATAAKASVESALAHAPPADAEAAKGMRSCLQLYTGTVPGCRPCSGRRGPWPPAGTVVASMIAA